MRNFLVLILACIFMPAASLATNPKIAEGSIYPISQKDYPKIYKKWGKANVDHINALAPKAAEKVAASSECDTVNMVDLSDERSIPKKSIVFFVDCNNGKRFYVSENELKTNATITSKQAKTATVSDSVAMETCIARVKAKLNHPSTFKLHMLSQNVYRAPTGNVVAQFEFSAKNSFNLETKNRVKCYIDDKGMSEPEIYEVGK